MNRNRELHWSIRWVPVLVLAVNRAKMAVTDIIFGRKDRWL